MIDRRGSVWKERYKRKLLDDYLKCFIVGKDNVGSKRHSRTTWARTHMMHKAIQGHLKNLLPLKKRLPHIQGNAVFVFTQEDLTETRDICVGATAPCEVTVPARNTGLGLRRVLSSRLDVQLIETGDKVGASEATLLNIGSIYNPEVLHITEETISYVMFTDLLLTVAPVAYSIINGYKWVLACHLLGCICGCCPHSCHSTIVPAVVPAKCEAKETAMDTGFGLWLITKEQLTKLTLFVKQRDNGLLLKPPPSKVLRRRESIKRMSVVLVIEIFILQYHWRSKLPQKGKE
ncbi:unnamed protein product [Nyctereutes procyonoides]|uniref:Large ribosomal subunit protein uL10 n=1 Tax=Nyctereutes procyonoides TaxID=34880 RepID=A0A811YRN8_NYCPR|nr:unnamed protein product [Nyctereutes procyonoides]